MSLDYDNKNIPNSSENILARLHLHPLREGGRAVNSFAHIVLVAAQNAAEIQLSCFSADIRFQTSMSICMNRKLSLCCDGAG